MTNQLLKCPDCDLYFNTQGGLDRHLREIDKLRNQREVNDALATVEQVQTEVREQTDEYGVALPGSKLEKDLNLPTEAEVNEVIESAKFTKPGVYVTFDSGEQVSLMEYVSKRNKKDRFARLKARVEREDKRQADEFRNEAEIKDMGDQVESDLNELVSALQPPPPVVADPTPAFAQSVITPVTTQFQFSEGGMIGNGVPLDQPVNMMPPTVRFYNPINPIANYEKYLNSFSNVTTPNP